MNKLMTSTLSILLLVSSPAVTASPIADEYMKGDILSVEKLTKIKDAVNHNDSVIKSNTSAINDNDINKQQRVTGTCPAGESIRRINVDGSVVCEAASVNKAASVNYSNIPEDDIGEYETFSSETNSLTLLRDIAIYEKQSSTSVILITYNDNLQTNGLACTIQVRVDGTHPDGGEYAAPIYTTMLKTPTFFSSTGAFSGLPSGSRTISLYKRAIVSTTEPTTCTRNSGNWHPTMTIIELEP